MKIESNDPTFETLFTEFYSVPDFQREFVWDSEDVEQFLGDIYEAFYDDGKLMSSTDTQIPPEYFIGSIVVYRDESSNRYHLIDGQQRLTTTFLVLCVIRDLLGQEEHSPLNNLIFASYADTEGVAHATFRLDLQYQESKGVLDKIATGGSDIEKIEGTTESIKRIKEAYATIKTFLQTKFGASNRELRQFYAVFTQRVRLIRIKTPSLRDALKIFETINDRGVGLDAMDLLKNLLFKEADEKEYARLKTTWKKLTLDLESCREKPLRFLRYFVMANYAVDPKELSEDRVYDWYVKNKTKLKIDVKPIAFVERLAKATQAYNNFAKGKDASGSEVEALKNIRRINHLARQHFVLLLAGANIEGELFESLAISIENLYFCYVLTRESNKTYERNFALWAEDVRSIKTEEDLNNFVHDILEPEFLRLAPRFSLSLAPDFLRTLANKRLRYIIAKLHQKIEAEIFPNEGRNLDYFLDKKVDIEHILPQSPVAEVSFDKPDEYDQYVFRLGNLTLLEKSINSSVSNSPFGVKVPGYRQSAFLLTRALASDPSFGSNNALMRALERFSIKSYDDWTASSILEREAELLRLAREVWTVPIQTETSVSIAAPQ